ncbi:MAG: ATP-binding cassette domain-containing protein [Pseudomonadota bacterium]
MNALLEVEDLEVRSDVAIVRPTSLTLRHGVPLTILGETGSGKSLLAQAIMGALAEGLRSAGTIAVRGTRFEAEADRRQLWGHTLSMLPQEPWLALDPTMRVRTQIYEGHRLVRGEPASRAARSTGDDLQRLDLSPATAKLPQALSGGMAQRVAFAAARAGGARITIADEPTKGLDAARRDDVVALLLSGLEQDGGLLTITHDVEVAQALGGEVGIMLDGALVERGPAERVLTAPQHPYTRRLIAAAPSNWPVVPRGSTGPERVRGRGLAKTRGGHRLFDGLDVTVPAGACISVTGPSGCGKTTLGDILLGLLQADSGGVWRDPAIARVRFQKIYQDPPAAFARQLTLRQAIDDLLRLHGLAWEMVRALMKRLKLAEVLLDRRPEAVSGGELQRFALLRVLLLDPVFIVADEPTSRLDPITQQETMDLLREMTEERETGLMLVTHDTAIARSFSHRIIELPGAAA